MYYDEDDREPWYNPEDFLEEYEVNLREIIAKAVNDKIKNTIEKLQIVEDENKELRNQVGELKRNTYNAERLHKDQLEKALKEKELEVQRSLSCGFIPHDKVYYIESTAKNTKCEQCNGNYKMEIEILGKKTKVHCPHCSYGNITTYTYSVKQDTVSSIYYNYHREDRNKKFGIVLNVDKIYLDKYDGQKSLTNLFKTLEEAQVECDKRNANKEYGKQI
jgi:hypothetical protein